MQALRNASFIPRILLAWFALFIGASVFSAVVTPQSVELVCSGSGAVKLPVKHADGAGHTARGHTMNCPLCLSAGAPPAACSQSFTAVQSRCYASPSIPSLRAKAFASGPLPARGPPTVLI